MTNLLPKVAAAMTTRAEALLLALAAALATAKRKRITERGNPWTQHPVAPMGKRGRWGGIKTKVKINSATDKSQSQVLRRETKGGAG